MSRVPLIDASTTTADRKALLEQIHGAFGATPNMFRAVANSPAALQSMWGSFGALGEGVIPAKLGEQIAVAIANRNACEYCLAAHTALGRKAGASAEEMSAAQGGNAADPKTAAALRFALKLVEARGPGRRCRRAGRAGRRCRRSGDRGNPGARRAQPVHQLRQRGVRGSGRLPRRETAPRRVTPGR